MISWLMSYIYYPRSVERDLLAISHFDYFLAPSNINVLYLFPIIKCDYDTIGTIARLRHVSYLFLNMFRKFL